MNDRKIEKIEDLDGVGPATAERLRDAGYTDLRSITNADPKVLAKAAGIGETTASRMINQARLALPPSMEDLPRRLVELEKVIEKQSERLDHFEDLHRIQALPQFFMLYVVDVDGPKDLKVSHLIGGEPACSLCGEPVDDGDFGYEIETRRFEELLNKKVKSRTAVIHFDCFYAEALSDRPRDDE